MIDPRGGESSELANEIGVGMAFHAKSNCLPCLVEVDYKKCDELAAVLKEQPIPPDREDSGLLGFTDVEVGNFYFAVVAICHQTSPVGHPPLEGRVDGEWKKGWDYLVGRFEAAANVDRELLDPRSWTRLNEHVLSSIYHDAETGNRLTDVAGRVALLQNAGEIMSQNSWSHVAEIHAWCEGRISIGTPNLLEVLREFTAYSDPVQKKSVFFLALMKNCGLWKYSDFENLGPPVDYHEVRGHLRLGTIAIVDDELLARLRLGEAVTAVDDIAIRSAVYNAIMYISNAAGIHNPSRLHYLFWNVFRAICTRSNPQCFELHHPNPLPDRYQFLAQQSPTPACPFSKLCRSAGESRPLVEHRFDTEYY